MMGDAVELWDEIINRMPDINLSVLAARGNLLRAEVIDLRKDLESDWISVKDRLPPNPGTYLCHTMLGYALVEWTGGGWMLEGVYPDLESFPWWMPLPAPPEVNDE
jgi:hypothetical protein